MATEHAYEPCSSYKVKTEMKIGELAVRTGVKAETIRFYEREKLLVPPVRTAANYRDYEAEHLSRLTFIRRARELGFTMAQVRELLALSDDRSRCCAAVDAVATAHLAEVEAKISRLQALREELSRLLADCKRGSVETCRIVETLSA